MQDTLWECERDVELARAKFADDLAILRSPKSFDEFTDALKREALQTQEELIGRAKGAARSKMTALAEDLKSKAAANPTAALMIGAGLGLFLLRHPPVTSALVGYGLFSLWNTPTPAHENMGTQDYLRKGQERLKEQVRSAASDAIQVAGSIAASAVDTVSAKSGELLETARETAADLTGQIRDQIADAIPAVQDKANDLISEGRSMAPRLMDEVRQTVASTSQVFPTAAPTAEARDRMLVGLAGLLVGAACLVSYQRRT